MINLIVEGYKLDLYTANISYKRTNNAFTFGKLTLNRTQSFNLPKTAKNMNVLGLGSALIFGENERRYFNAQLQGSGIVENGLLYIDSVDKDFTCIFIFGSLIKLKEIANVKKMADALGSYDSVIQGIPVTTNIKKADATNLALYDAVEYRNDYYTGYFYSNIMPSISVRGLINCANEIWGNTFDLSAVPDYRIIQGTTKAPSRDNIIFAKETLNVFAPEQNIKLMLDTYNTYMYICTSGTRGDYTELAFKRYLTLRDTEIKLPADFPEDRFIVQDNSYYDSTSGYVVIDLEFFGGYSFEIDQRAVNNINEEGERDTIGIPLAGRTITIPAGKQFSFYKKSDFHNTKDAGASGSFNNYRGFFARDNAPFELPAVEVSLSEEGQWGTNNYKLSYMLDNLPSISFIDLYNSVAILQGKYITFANNLVTAVDYDSINELLHLKEPISATGLKREALTSAKNNYLKFAENEIVKPANRIVDNYPIANDLLEKEETIYSYPYSEGEEFTDNNDLFINNIQTGEPDPITGFTSIELKSDIPVIALAGAGNYLKRVATQKIDLINQIYAQSTRVEVSYYMSFYEYMQIKETNVIIYNNLKWVWASATWQAGKAKFVLYKI